MSQTTKAPMDEAESVSIDIPLHPKQRAAINSPAQQTLFGGAAGGGKSYMIRAAAIIWCLSVPGLNFYLFRRTYGDLQANHFEGHNNFREMLAPLVHSGHCTITQRRIRFSNGSIITLNSIQGVKGLDRYQGRQIHALGVDEATHFTDAEIRYLMGRCRLGGLELPADCPWTFPRVLMSANPGGIGHHWAKAGFVDHGEFTVFQANRKNGRKTRVYIPSRLPDNPTMTETDPDYAESLGGLGDPLLVRAMLEGDWNVVAGSMFGDVWRPSRHIQQPFDIPIEWPLWRGADDGFGSPACVLWFTQDPTTKTYYIIHELYGSRLLPDRMTELVLGIDRRVPRLLPDGETEDHDATLKGIMDSAAFGDTGQQEGIPRARQMNARGANWIECEKWQGSRVAGCQNIHKLLAPNPLEPPDRDGRKPPGLRIFANCRNLIRTLPTLPRDPRNPEDVDTDADDHAYDALRYGLQWKKSGFRKLRIHGK